MSIRGAKILQRELKSFIKNPYNEFSVNIKDGDLYKWDICIFGPNDTPYEGGIFRAEMEFPKDYPNHPPTMKFIDDVYHPNIYPDGKVCISILHDGVDEFGYESSAERWLPTHGVSSVLMSIISMISEPNIESPANIDAGVMFRDNKVGFNKKVYECVIKTQELFV